MKIILINVLQKASRAQILNKATDYIQFMRRKNHTHQVSVVIYCSLGKSCISWTMS